MSGTFTKLGAWKPGVEPDGVHELVRRLMHVVQTYETSPYDITNIVAGSQHPLILGSSIFSWRRIKHAALWYEAHAATSAAQTIKRVAKIPPLSSIPPDCECSNCVALRQLENDPRFVYTPPALEPPPLLALLPPEPTP